MRLMRFVPLLIFFLISCAEKEEKLTMEEAMDVAHKIDSSISHKRPNYYNELFDATAFARKVAKLADVKMTSEMIQGAKAALVKAEFGDKIIQSLGEGGRYELVKHYVKGDVHHLLFRLYATDGLNYHDLELSKRNGKAAIADMYIYMSGENLSKTLSSLLSSFFEKSGKNESGIIQLAQSVDKIRRKLMNNEFRQAMSYYESLPTDIKDQRTIQLIYLQICKGLGDDQYLKAMTDFQTKYPNDPNINLIMIDAHFLQKEYDKALEAVNKLDLFIDRDPFLDFYRALISNMSEQPAEARKYLEQLYKNYPGFDSGVLELIANYINAGMDDKARDLIRVYEDNEQFNQTNLQNYLYTQPRFIKNAN